MPHHRYQVVSALASLRLGRSFSRCLLLESVVEAAFLCSHDRGSPRERGHERSGDARDAPCPVATTPDHPDTDARPPRSQNPTSTFPPLGASGPPSAPWRERWRQPGPGCTRPQPPTARRRARPEAAPGTRGERGGRREGACTSRRPVPHAAGACIPPGSVGGGRAAHAELSRGRTAPAPGRRTMPERPSREPFPGRGGERAPPRRRLPQVPPCGAWTVRSPYAASAVARSSGWSRSVVPRKASEAAAVRCGPSVRPRDPTSDSTGGR